MTRKAKKTAKKKARAPRYDSRREYPGLGRLANMTAETAIRLLDDELGSGDDPITYRKQETSPNELQHLLGRGGAKASSVRITYFNGHGRQVRNGTLCAMVRDRLEDPEIDTPRKRARLARNKRPKVATPKVRTVEGQSVDKLRDRLLAEATSHRTKAEDHRRKADALDKAAAALMEVI